VDGNNVESAESVNMTAEKGEAYEDFRTEPFLQELCEPLQSCNTESSVAQVTFSFSSNSANDDNDDDCDVNVEQGRPH